MLTELVKKFRAVYGTKKIHYCIQKSLPLIPILSQMDPVWKPLAYLFKVIEEIT
jgi:hypothetical protein